jgi:hypothetical protein
MPVLDIAASLDHLVGADSEVGGVVKPIATASLAATKGVSVIPAHGCKWNVRNLGKRPDTRRMVFASRKDSRDIVHDRYLRNAVYRSEPP